MAEESIQTGVTGNTPTINTAELKTTYANACRIAQTPNEMVVDFGLFFGSIPAEGLKLETRVILTPDTAKRLMLNLASALQAHEAAFGVIELDVNKRRKA